MGADIIVNTVLDPDGNLVGVFSGDASRRETMRACREAVEYFMEARLRIQRIGDRISNGCAHTGCATFPCAFHTQRVMARRCVFGDDHLDIRYFARTRQ